MHGVGPGSTLGGRYALAHRLQEHPRYERWLAQDQTLQRDVVLLCFPGDGALADAALDAARRAAGVDEARLVRVLDVGRDGEAAFVVEEPLTHARDLVELLDGGPLPAQEARRLVGEAATALERARSRGLHHGVLGPRSLLRQDDGGVKVRGLAVEGALLGLDDVDGARASRDDTVALVALSYAALTGHWPLTSPVGPDDGLPAAPVMVGGVAAPSEITSGVPADLDTIARLTLADDVVGSGGDWHGGAGPETPGDLARQIAPWPSEADPGHVRPAVAPPVVSVAPAAGAAAAALVTAGAPAPAARRAPTVLGMSLEKGDTAGRRSLDRGADTGVDAGVDAGPGASAVGGTPPAGSRVRDAVRDTDSLDLRAVAGGRGAGVQGVDVGDDGDDNDWDDPTDDDADVARDEHDDESPASRPPRGSRLRMTSDVRLSDTLLETDEDLDSPLPMVGRRTAAASSVDHAGVALAALAVLVVVAAVLGIYGVSRIGRSSTPSVASTTSSTATAGSTPTASPTTTAGETAAAGALTPIGIVQAQAWDPQGDNQEGNASAPRSFDGDGSTAWRSQTYRTAPFGGLDKTGIGLILDLGQQQTVKQVQVDLRGGSDLTVYVASRESLDGATTIGTSTGTDGTVTVTAPDAGAKGQLVILWFTKLAPDGEGGFRAQVAEARVSG